MTVLRRRRPDRPPFLPVLAVNLFCALQLGSRARGADLCYLCPASLQDRGLVSSLLHFLAKFISLLVLDTRFPTANFAPTSSWIRITVD
jgi:hypothetical protein